MDRDKSFERGLQRVNHQFLLMDWRINPEVAGTQHHRALQSIGLFARRQLEQSQAVARRKNQLQFERKAGDPGEAHNQILIALSQPGKPVPRFEQDRFNGRKVLV